MTALEMPSKKNRINRSSQGVYVVNQQGLQLRALLQEPAQGAVQDQVWNLIKMPHGMKALPGQVIGIIARLPTCPGPFKQSGT